MVPEHERVRYSWRINGSKMARSDSLCLSSQGGGGREKRTPPCVADKTSASLVSFATVLPGYVLGMCVHRVAGIMRALFPEIIVALLPPLLFFLSLSLPPPHLPSPISSLSAILSLLSFLLLYLSISVSCRSTRNCSASLILSSSAHPRLAASPLSRPFSLCSSRCLLCTW